MKTISKKMKTFSTTIAVGLLLMGTGCHKVVRDYVPQDLATVRSGISRVITRGGDTVEFTGKGADVRVENEDGKPAEKIIGVTCCNDSTKYVPVSDVREIRTQDSEMIPFSILPLSLTGLLLLVGIILSSSKY